jgi:hypothetical protein
MHLSKIILDNSSTIYTHILASFLVSFRSFRVWKTIIDASNLCLELSTTSHRTRLHPLPCILVVVCHFPPWTIFARSPLLPPCWRWSSQPISILCGLCLTHHSFFVAAYFSMDDNSTIKTELWQSFILECDPLRHPLQFEFPSTGQRFHQVNQNSHLQELTPTHSIHININNLHFSNRGPNHPSRFSSHARQR